MKQGFRSFAASFAALSALALLLAPVAGNGAERKRYCRDFANYQEVVAFCEARYGTTIYCGGLDRDRDGLPCECTVGGPDSATDVCGRWRRRADNLNRKETGAKP